MSFVSTSNLPSTPLLDEHFTPQSSWIFIATVACLEHFFFLLLWLFSYFYLPMQCFPLAYTPTFYHSLSKSHQISELYLNLNSFSYSYFLLLQHFVSLLKYISQFDLYENHFCHASVWICICMIPRRLVHVFQCTCHFIYGKCLILASWFDYNKNVYFLPFMWHSAKPYFSLHKFKELLKEHLFLLFIMSKWLICVRNSSYCGIAIIYFLRYMDPGFHKAWNGVSFWDRKRTWFDLRLKG